MLQHAAKKYLCVVNPLLRCLLLVLTACCCSCGGEKKMKEAPLTKKITVHGHRGARGHFPENTLTAFKGAASMGVDALELDVIISADSQVVVSHEPWMHPHYCSTPEGKNVKHRREYNLYKMRYAEIAKFDCGSRGNAHFPQQEKISEHKPLLKTVIAEMERYTRENGLPPITYNIEIKCLAPGDGKYHPKPAPFAKLVNAVIRPFGINERLLIQSFDLRVLREMHRLDSTLRIGILVMGPSSVKRRVKKLGFTPYMYNPDYRHVNPKLLREAHAQGISVHPYTVNDTAEMRKLLRMGVDGIISDYPEKVLEVVKRAKS